LSNTTNNSIGSSISVEENQIKFFLNTDESYSSSSSTSSIIKTLHKPIARRADGSEIIINSTERPLHHASSNILLFKHCHFPRSLKSQEQVTTSIISEKQLPYSPIEQFDNNQLFHLLDQIETECSPMNFTTMLNQLTLSTVQTNEINNNISLINDNQDEIKENIIIINPNLFDQSSLSHDYYTTFTLNIDNPKKIFVYTMTIGIVQLSPCLTVPYSILNGRRPLLECSIETNFKKIHTKRSNHTCQVIAIESLTNIESLKENDILLKVRCF
jgi:hypothetical protein